MLDTSKEKNKRHNLPRIKTRLYLAISIVIVIAVQNLSLSDLLKKIETGQLREQMEVALKGNKVIMVEVILDELANNPEVTQVEIGLLHERLALAYVEVAEMNWGVDWEVVTYSVVRACMLGHSGACRSSSNIIIDIIKGSNSTERATFVYNQLKKMRDECQ